MRANFESNDEDSNKENSGSESRPNQSKKRLRSPFANKRTTQFEEAPQAQMTSEQLEEATRLKRLRVQQLTLDQEILNIELENAKKKSQLDQIEYRNLKLDKSLGKLRLKARTEDSTLESEDAIREAIVKTQLETEFFRLQLELLDVKRSKQKLELKTIEADWVVKRAKSWLRFFSKTFSISQIGIKSNEDYLVRTTKINQERLRTVLLRTSDYSEVIFQAAERLLKLDARETDWSDIYSIELLLVELLPDEQLDLELTRLRTKYFEVTGKHVNQH